MLEVENRQKLIPNEFFEGRMGCPFDEGTYAYIEWWREQKGRCLNGFEYKGTRLTGRNYFYINFIKINRLDDKGRIQIFYPRYNEVDKYIFDCIEEAQDKGKALALLTARGMGKTYLSIGGVVAYEYTFFPSSWSIISASTPYYADLTFLKFLEILDDIPTEFSHNRIKSTSDFVMSGYAEVDDNGVTRNKGYKSKVEKIVYEHKSGKTRGNRPNVQIFEEVGAWNGGAGLIDCYEKSSSAWMRGNVSTCFAMLIGTGGEMKSGGTTDIKEMIYNPKAFNLLEVDNRYVYAGEPRNILFIPAYAKLEGFYSEEKKNDEVAAKAFIEEEREKKRENRTAYEQYLQEYPFSLKELFLIGTDSPFSILRDRLYDIEIDPSLRKVVKTGKLKLTGRNCSDGLPEVEFIEHKEGWLKILEKPLWVTNDNTFDDSKIVYSLYISGCDSYDQDKANTSNSKGSCMVYKRFLNADTSADLFVCDYTERPEEADTFYERTMLVNWYYRSKMLVEHTKISIIKHYEKEKATELLWERPRVAYANMPHSKASNKIGLNMDERIKDYCIERYKKYVSKYKDNFFFSEQITDHIEFNKKENRFDRTIASMLCIVQDNEMYEIKAYQEEKTTHKKQKWRKVNGNYVFC